MLGEDVGNDETICYFRRRYLQLPLHTVCQHGSKFIGSVFIILEDYSVQ
jgi:hypothetical protein